jgi:hypothetical protein
MNTNDPRITAMREVIRNLRKTDLANGHCFMIHDKSLPKQQAYYEYPDGSIQIEEVDASNLYNPRKIVRKLSASEVAAVVGRHAVFG